eukprot:m.214954 g.214954  ORF g.214954 m.214954 type:complete len:112 (+) comp16971_c0_seq2:1030-1365(+)
MRGIGADDGRLVFANILQKYMTKLTTDTHALLWLKIDKEQILPSDAQARSVSEQLVQALQEGVPISLSCVMIDPNTRRSLAYDLSIGLHIIANQLDELFCQHKFHQRIATS